VEVSLLEEVEDSVPILENILSDNVKEEADCLNKVAEELKEDVILTKFEMRKWKLIT